MVSAVMWLILRHIWQGCYKGSASVAKLFHNGLPWTAGQFAPVSPIISNPNPVSQMQPSMRARYTLESRFMVCPSNCEIERLHEVSD